MSRTEENWKHITKTIGWADIITQIEIYDETSNYISWKIIKRRLGCYQSNTAIIWWLEGNYNNSPDLSWDWDEVFYRTFSLSVARNGSVTSDQDLRRQNGTPTNQSPYIIPFPCKLVSISAGSNPASWNVTWNAQLLKNWTVEATLAIVANTKSLLDTYSNAFIAGDEIRFRVDHTGETINRPWITARFLETN